eukprot:m.67188 g.67188  ORF g.67188 m.67188 type:complete len:471 (-) comp14098_c0_seq1:372-1784(-)
MTCPGCRSHSSPVLSAAGRGRRRGRRSPTPAYELGNDGVAVEEAGAVDGLVGEFAAQATRHELAHLLRVAVLAEQVAELRHHGLGRHVDCGGHAGLDEDAARCVCVEDDAAVQALGGGKDEDAALAGEVEQLEELRLAERDVARAEDLKDEGLDGALLDDVCEDLGGEARDEADDEDAGLDGLVGAERGAGLRQGQAGVDADVDGEGGERLHVGRLEGSQAKGVDLGGAVGAHELLVEEDADLREVCADGKDHADNEVAARVVVDLAEGDHRAGEDHRLAQILQQKGHRRGRIGHRVRAHNHHKAVIQKVVFLNVFGQPEPVSRSHAGRVHQRRVLLDVEEGHLGALQLVDVLQHLLQVAWAVVEAADVVRLHGKGAARVDDQHLLALQMALVHVNLRLLGLDLVVRCELVGVGGSHVDKALCWRAGDGLLRWVGRRGHVALAAVPAVCAERPPRRHAELAVAALTSRRS